MEASEAGHAEFVIYDQAIDITSIRLHREFIYLAVVMDVFTRTIRGWNLGRSLGGELTLVALKRALVGRQRQGEQYRREYQADFQNAKQNTSERGRWNQPLPSFCLKTVIEPRSLLLFQPLAQRFKLNFTHNDCCRCFCQQLEHHFAYRIRRFMSGLEILNPEIIESDSGCTY